MIQKLKGQLEMLKDENNSIEKKGFTYFSRLNSNVSHLEQKVENQLDDVFRSMQQMQQTIKYLDLDMEGLREENNFLRVLPIIPIAYNNRLNIKSLYCLCTLNKQKKKVEGISDGQKDQTGAIKLNKNPSNPNEKQARIKYEDLVHEVELLKNKFDSVERVKNDHWFDTSKKMAEVENKLVGYEKSLNKKVKEIRDNIFTNFSKNNVDLTNRNLKKVEIVETEQKELKHYVEILEKRISKTLENREE